MALRSFGYEFDPPLPLLRTYILSICVMSFDLVRRPGNPSLDGQRTVSWTSPSSQPGLTIWEKLIALLEPPGIPLITRSSFETFKCTRVAALIFPNAPLKRIVMRALKQLMWTLELISHSRISRRRCLEKTRMPRPRKKQNQVTKAYPFPAVRQR